MSGCSLQDAFPDTAKQSGKIARKEEREKVKKCGGPALKFLKSVPSDADRQTPPLPPSEKLGGSTGWKRKTFDEGFVSQDSSNREYTPVKASDFDLNERAAMKSLIGQSVDDVIGEKSRKSLPRSSESSAELPDVHANMYGDAIPSYFGKTSSDGFADFSTSMADTAGYSLGADFSASFGKRGLDSATGNSLPPPSINDSWKIITPNGIQTSFFGPGPAPGYGSGPGYSPAPAHVPEAPQVFSMDEKRTLLNKLDTLFARLSDLETKKNEYANVEVSLFIFSGLFLLFGLEAVRKI